MMYTHRQRSRQGTRDQVRTKPLNAQIPLRPKERTENAVRVVLGFLLQSFHLFLGCHYIFTVASPPSHPHPDCPLLCLTPGWAVKTASPQSPWRGVHNFLGGVQEYFQTKAAYPPGCAVWVGATKHHCPFIRLFFE